MDDDKLFKKRMNPPKSFDRADRPVLPVTTPTPQLSGGSNPYSTLIPPQSKSTRDPYENSGQIYRKKDISLNRIMTKLPFEVRESVSSVVSLALTENDISKKSLETCNTELMLLKADLKKKTHELEQANRRCDIYASRLNSMEQKVESLQDNVDTQQKFSFRSKRAVNRLSTTNRVLIDAFEALQTRPISPSSTFDSSSPGTHTQSHSDSSSALQNIPGASSNPNRNNVQNDKLRESLLRIAREHYRSVKSAEALETKVDELQSKLKVSENKSRDLEVELTELKELSSSKLYAAGMLSSQSEENNQKIKIKTTKQSLEIIDEKFKRLLERNAFDPTDGLTQMRKILSCFETLPSSLQTLETSLYLCSSEICKIFDVESIFLYIYEKNSNSITRYVTNKSDVELFHLGDSTDGISIIQEVLRTGQPMRLNHLKESKMPTIYNPDIDSAQGLVIKKYLGIPIIDRRNSITIGALAFINKSKNSNTIFFSELDEIFGTMFADHTSMVLTSCILYRNIAERADLLHHLLESSTAVFNAVPDKHSFSASKILRVEDVLSTLENVTKDVLKCLKCKAYLVSECCGQAVGSLLTFDISMNGKKITYTSSKSTTMVPITSGLAGHVVRTKRLYVAFNTEFDNIYNPLVDLNVLENVLTAIPVVDVYGTVIACLEVVAGPSSPKYSGNLLGDNGVNFEEASEWLAHQLATPLRYLLQFVGRSANAPASAPKLIPVPSFGLTRGLSLLPKKMFEEEQVVTVNSDDFPAILGSSSQSFTHGLPSSARNIGKIPSLESEPASHRRLSGHRSGSDGGPTPFGFRVPSFQKQPSTIIRTTFRVVEAVSVKEEEHDVDGVIDRSPLTTSAKEPVDNMISVSEYERLKRQLDEAAANAEKSKRQEEEKTKRMEDLQSESKELQKQIQLLKSSYESSLDASNDLKKRLKELEEKHATVSALNLGYEMEIKILKESESSRKRELESLKASMSERLQTESQQLAASREEDRGKIAELEEKLILREREELSLREEVKGLKLTIKNQTEELAANEFELDRLRDDVQVLVVDNENRKITRTLSEAGGPEVALTLNLLQPGLLHGGDGTNFEEFDEVPEVKLPSLVREDEEQNKLPSLTTAATQAVEKNKSNEEFIEKIKGENVASEGQSSSRKPSGNTLKKESSEKEKPSGPTPRTSRIPTPTAKNLVDAAASGGMNHTDWMEINDGLHPVYYYNHVTCESSWECPPELAQHLALYPASSDHPPHNVNEYSNGMDDDHIVTAGHEMEVVRNGSWIQSFDEFGRMYWFNEISGESAWEIPTKQRSSDSSSHSQEGKSKDLPSDTSPKSHHSYGSVSAGGYTIEI